MKRKGFTLVELLAVIVILAVVAIISIPLIGNVIENVKEQSLKQSANGLIEAADFYYSTHQDIVEPITFDFVGGSQISEEKLDYKGSIKEGKLILSTSGESVICIGDGKYYAYKGIEDNEVVTGEGSCEYDGENFIITSDIDTLRKENNQLKSEINNGKNEIATAITNKGIETSNTDSFTNMATNIGAINVGINRTDLLNVLEYSGLGLTSESTGEEILLALQQKFPQKSILGAPFIVSDWNGQTFPQANNTDPNNYTYSIQSDKISLHAAKSSETSYAGVKTQVNYKNKIDLTPYKTLKIIGTATRTYNSGTETNLSIYINGNVVSVSMNPTEINLTIDISEYGEDSYISFGANASSTAWTSNTCSIDVNITKVELLA